MESAEPLQGNPVEANLSREKENEFNLILEKRFHDLIPTESELMTRNNSISQLQATLNYGLRTQTTAQVWIVFLFLDFSLIYFIFRSSHLQLFYSLIPYSLFAIYYFTHFLFSIVLFIYSLIPYLLYI
jgi:hypothetical protein